ncbi:hypothetical protein B566_EDAN007698 [Ephemera danica]|nr:hypothetical protein B566_EDAN007698 [Ephemera danica]
MVSNSRRKLVAVLLLGLAGLGVHAHPSTSEHGTANTANGVRFPSAEQVPSKLAKESQAVKDLDASGASARLGFLTNSIYPGSYSTGTGQYAASSPLKLDLGGLLVGGAIGLGLIFLVPKLFYPHGGDRCYNGRSVDEGETGATQLLARLDQALAEHKIDSTSCAQRVLCSYVQQATTKVLNGSATNFDKVIGDVSSKATAENLFGSSDYQKALEVGRTNGDCAAAFSMCPSDTSHVFGAIKSFVMGSLV